jgi:DNA-binding transcriptional MerR regulator
MAYTVGEMARRLGVPASTIRYYDKEGLMPSVLPRAAAVS